MMAAAFALEACNSSILHILTTRFQGTEAKRESVDE